MYLFQIFILQYDRHTNKKWYMPSKEVHEYFTAGVFWWEVHPHQNLSQTYILLKKVERK